jgi:hypothetical protein
MLTFLPPSDRVQLRHNIYKTCDALKPPYSAAWTFSGRSEGTRDPKQLTGNRFISSNGSTDKDKKSSSKV